MSTPSNIAEKYAMALFEVCKENNSVIEVAGALSLVNQQISREEFDVLKNSTISSQISFKEMIKTAFASAVKDKGLQSFLLILVDNGRVGLLPEIVDEFNKLADKNAGVLRGDVRSSRQLKDVEMQKLTSAVEENLNQKVSLNFNVDPSLIGGFEINVGGYQFVDSIRGHLNKLSEVVRRSTN